MATKVGEAYFEIYPRINQAAANAARKAIGKGLSDQFDQEQRKMVGSAERSNRDIVNDDKTTATKRESVNRNTTGRMSADEAKLRRNRKNNNNGAINDENALSRIRSAFSKRFQKDMKDNETGAHRVATQFRTIGTIMRGLAVTGAVIGGMKLLLTSIQGIAAAMPILKAGLLALPAGVAGLATEALILKAAFKGVGTAVKDGLDPSKAKQFNEELKKLAPSARTFVRTLVSALKGLPNIQQVFFSQPAIKKAESQFHSFIGGISGGLKNLVAANGNLFGKIFGTLTNGPGTKLVNAFLNNMATMLRKITPGLQAVAHGFEVIIAKVSGEGANRAGSVNGVLEKLGKFLTSVNVHKIFDDAKHSIDKFKPILDDVRKSFDGLMRALGGSKGAGDTFFTNVGKFTHEVSTYINSNAGQQFIKQLQSMINSLSTLASAGLGTALGSIGKIIVILAPALASIANWAKSNPGTFRTIATIIGAIALSFKAWNAAMAIYKGVAAAVRVVTIAWTAAQVGLDAAMDANPIGLIALAIIGLIAAIAALVTGIILLVKHFSQISHFFNGTLGTDIAIAMAVLVPFIGVPLLIIGHWRGVVTFFKTVWHGLEIGGKAVVHFFTTTFLNFFTKTVPHWFAVSRHAIAAAWDGVASFFVSWWNRIWKFFTQSIPHFFTVTVPGWFRSGVNFIKGIWNGIVNFFVTWWNRIWKFFTQSIPNFIKGILPGWFKTGVNLIVNHWSAVQAGITRVWDGIWKFLTQSVPHFITGTVPGWFKSGLNIVAGAFTWVLKRIEGWWGDVWKFITVSIPRFFTVTVPGWFKSGLNIVAGWFTWVLKRIEGWWGDVYKFVTQSVPHFFTVTVPNWFKSGLSVVAGWFTWVLKRIEGWWGDVYKFITQSVPHFFTVTVPSWFKSAMTTVAGWFTWILKRIQGWWNDVYKFITGSVPHFFTVTVVGWFTHFGNLVAGIFVTILKKIQGWINDVINAFKGAWGAVGRAFTGILNAISKPVKVLVDIVYTKGIKGFWDKIAGPLKAPVMKGLSFINPFATGGYVRPNGGGGPTQDNVPALLSQGEYVIRTKQAKKHLPLLEYINGGGDVGPGPNMRHQSGDVRLHHQDPQVYGAGFAGGGMVFAPVIKLAAGGGVPSGVTARVAPTLAWLKSIAGKVPYVLGSNGPNAFDCSSLVGAVWARLVGQNPNHRYFVTQTENSWAAHHGFSKGADPSGFTIGTNGEHTTGILAGHRFEAAHTGTKMRFDDGAMAATSFPSVWHMTGVTGLGGGGHLTGILGKIQDMKHQMADYIQTPVQKIIDPQMPGSDGYPRINAEQLFGPKAGKTSATGKLAAAAGGAAAKTGSLAGLLDDKYGMAKMLTGVATLQNVAATAFAQKKLDAAIAAAATEFGGGTFLAAGAGQISKWISEASKYANIPASWVPGIMTIISRESGGNPNAVNHSDSNAAAGHPSEGLMQVIGPTFNAYVPAALKSRGLLDPVANIAAAVNYIHARYGDISKVQQANPNKPPHGYSKGGKVGIYDGGGVLQHGDYALNKSGKPEGVFTVKQFKDAMNTAGGGPVTIIIDGVDVTSKAHITKNNQAIAASLNRK